MVLLLTKVSSYSHFSLDVELNKAFLSNQNIGSATICTCSLYMNQKKVFFKFTLFGIFIQRSHNIYLDGKLRIFLSLFKPSVYSKKHINSTNSNLYNCHISKKFCNLKISFLTFFGFLCWLIHFHYTHSVLSSCFTW